MLLALLLVGWATAQSTQSGCSCKSSSEVKWRLSGGKIGGGFSHFGCGTGPYEDKSPAKGQNWCDTQQSGCNDGQGWDFCSAAPSLQGDLGAEAVNVNTGVNPQSYPNAGSSALNLNVNVNVGGTSNSNPGTITTVQGCTCHPTSEVILMQNGVRVGGGFSHTGCGTGPYEASSPGKGSPWCDTMETWCSAGWDLCVPPSSSAQPNSYNQAPAQNSFTSTTNSITAFSNAGVFQSAFPPTPYFVPPTPYLMPPAPFQPRQPAYQPQPPPYQSTNPFQPVQQPFQPAYQAPSYQPPQTQSQFVAQSQYPSAYVSAKTSVAITPVPVSKPAPQPQSRTTFTSSRSTATSTRPRARHSTRGSKGNSDYDYDDSSHSSSSPLLPLLLLKGASGGSASSSSSSLLPLMLASQGGGGSSSMLPMMMMMNPGGFGANSNMLSQFAMLSAFRREGDGEAQNASSLGEVGQTLGFTRAVVSKSVASPVVSVDLSAVGNSTSPMDVESSAVLAETSDSP